MTRLSDWFLRHLHLSTRADSEFTEASGSTIATRIAIDCYTTLQGRFACNFTLESDTAWHLYLIILDLPPSKPYILAHPEMWQLVRVFPRPFQPPASL